MRLNENYTFEGAADKTLRLSAAFSVFRMSRYRVPKVSVGLQLEPVRRCLDALEELESLAMYQEDPPL
ncbi:hypothetical protein TNCV_2852581 [Trichonephila clavipes]|uniref:Uncharacterized protein n=1 Tax=Trichonephila clavipes TaxID=2585209 RepID=A0A8X6R5U0_TRICX|nr:hypothetical protein TNCV_2852581 [Trichonephila clavipes]